MVSPTNCRYSLDVLDLIRIWVNAIYGVILYLQINLVRIYINCICNCYNTCIVSLYKLIGHQWRIYITIRLNVRTIYKLMSSPLFSYVLRLLHILKQNKIHHNYTLFNTNVICIFNYRTHIYPFVIYFYAYFLELLNTRNTVGTLNVDTNQNMKITAVFT